MGSKGYMLVVAATTIAAAVAMWDSTASVQDVSATMGHFVGTAQDTASSVQDDTASIGSVADAMGIF